MTDADRIIAAIEAITGGPFKPSRGQFLTPAKGHTVDAIIASLPEQFADARKEVMEGLNHELFGSEQAGEITLDMIPPSMVAGMIATNRAVSGFGGHETFMSNDLNPYQGFEIGREYERRQVAPIDPIECAYLTILGRPSEPDGHAYWTGQHKAGEPLSKIFWHIENSPEAKRKRAGG